MSNSFEFLCTGCDQRFRVSPDKVGAKLRCPRCQTNLSVPTPEIGAIQLAAREARRRPEPAVAFDEFVVYDDKPLAVPDVSVVGIAADIAEPSTPTENRGRDDSGMVMPSSAMAARLTPSGLFVPRVVLYALAGLLAAVAVSAFLLGVICGGLFGGRDGAQSTPSGPIEFHGGVLYHDNHALRPDVNSLVLVMPAGKTPQEPIDADAIRAEVLAGESAGDSMKALQVLGGGVTQVAADGTFSMSLPEASSYWILALSAHQSRPRHLDPPIEELATLGRYFRPAHNLIGDRQYHWQRRALPTETPLEIEF